MINIFPQDNRMCIDGVWRTVAIDRPDTVAARLNGALGSVEYREHNGAWKSPETLTDAQFRERYAAEIAAFAAAPDDVRPASTPSAPPDDVVATLRAQIAGLQAQVAFVIANSDAPDPNAG